MCMVSIQALLINTPLFISKRWQCFFAQVKYFYLFVLTPVILILPKSSLLVLVNKSKEGYASIYNWGYINSLRVWGKVLTVNHQLDFTRQLTYPFIQICQGGIVSFLFSCLFRNRSISFTISFLSYFFSFLVLSLNPSSLFFPLHFQVIEMMIAVAAAHHLYIPLSAQILRILQHSDLSKVFFLLLSLSIAVIVVLSFFLSFFIFFFLLMNDRNHGRPRPTSCTFERI